MEFTKYEKYKDSSLEWLGTIPDDWEVKRVKDLFNLITDLAPTNNDYQLLSIYTSIGVKPREELEQRGNKAVTTDGYWIVKKGDFIVNKLLAWMGAIALSDYDGVTSPAYDVLRKKTPLVQKYYEYLFRTEMAQGEFKKNSRGIMEVRLRLYFDKFGAISVPLQRIEEQQQIVDYLDRKTAQIDKKTELLQSKKAMYQELRKTLITEAVTKGVDKSVELKDSGVEWLGRIAKHWEVIRFKELVSQLQSGSRDKGGAVESGVVSISAEHIDWDGKFKLTNLKFISNEFYERMNAGKVRANDILITKDGATIGKTAIVEQMYFKAMAINEHMYLVRSKRDVLPKFLYYLIVSVGLAQIRRTMKDTAVPGINSNILSDTFLVKPSKAEQLAIVKHLDEKINKIDEIIATIDKNVEALSEFRRVLIRDAVTGKIRVVRPETLYERTAITR